MRYLVLRLPRIFVVTKAQLVSGARDFLQRSDVLSCEYYVLRHLAFRFLSLGMNGV